MIEGHPPVLQTLLGTLLTWGFTAAGAGLVFVFQSGQRKVLDGSLGFAAGVMLAASFWSLLEPALELAAASGSYGSDGQWAFAPVGVGFIVGALFVLAADRLLPEMSTPAALLGIPEETNGANPYEPPPTIPSDRDASNTGDSVRRRTKASSVEPNGLQNAAASPVLRDAGTAADTKVVLIGQERASAAAANWKRIILLIIAITVHNIPEGLAVGVGFGAAGKSSASTFQNARNLAIGIGIQNFPEGLSVSLPLRGAGFSAFRSFWYGQLSGMVEPVAGLLGVLAVGAAQPLLPYALAFAAGAMVYVVVDDIIPEAQRCGNGQLASCCCILGFLVMMSLDVGLG